MDRKVGVGGGGAFGVHRKGELEKLTSKIKQTKNKQTNKQTNKKVSNLNIFFFNGENSVTNKKVYHKKVKYVRPPPPPSVGGKCSTMPLVSMQSIKKCSEVSSGLRRPQMGPGWHWFRRRGWCVVWELKLKIIGT